MKDLIKQQDEELNSLIIGGYENRLLLDEIALTNFISKVRKETAEYVCDKMVGTEYADEIKFEWNDRIIREKEIKQSILQDFKQEVNKMACDECEDECNPIVYSLCLRRRLDEQERSTDV